MNPSNPTNSETEQTNRWNKFVNQWTRASQLNQCVIIGDINLDINKWTKPEHSQVNMVNLVKEKIETLNFAQKIVGATRFWNGTAPSLIVHVWTDCVDKIVSTMNINRAAADHNLIGTTIRVKGQDNSGHESIRRDRSKFSTEEYTTEIGKI